RQSGKAATLLLGNRGVVDGETTHRGLISNSALGRNRRPARLASDLLHHHARGHEVTSVPWMLHHLLFAKLHIEGIVRIGPAEIAQQLARIRVEQQLVWIEAMSLCNVPGTVDSISIHRPRLRSGQIAVPDLMCDTWQVQALYVM